MSSQYPGPDNIMSIILFPREINSTLDRVDRMLVDATIASSLDSLYREIVNDTQTATNVKEVLQLAVDDSERQARSGFNQFSLS